VTAVDHPGPGVNIPDAFARSGVTAARGFRAAGAASGIKPTGALDLSVVVADAACPAAAVFTTSLAPAPPVELDRQRVEAGPIRALIVNSGVANAGTGAAGTADARAMGASLAGALACPDDQVLVCSTGVIGPRVPVERVSAAVPGLVAALGSDPDHATAAARGIMTTDSVPKQAEVHGDGWVVGGMAKGAGMLRPDMATMLAFLTTDAVASADVLGAALRRATASTFNCLNVDGCQSTNDTVILMASGASGVEPGTQELEDALTRLCADLALQMAVDAEGATKVVHIEVDGTADDDAARRLGRQVADSALVRSAFHGSDPNWGRVLAALGVAGVAIDQAAVEIAFDGTVVCRHGAAVDCDEDELSARLAGDFTVTCTVGAGPGSAVIVTTDLTPDYVVFNSERS
jgi:glutamate N-acetyltransferase/amino-acid N-acetyltransferase